MKSTRVERHLYAEDARAFLLTYRLYHANMGKVRTPMFASVHEPAPPWMVLSRSEFREVQRERCVEAAHRGGFNHNASSSYSGRHWSSPGDCGSRQFSSLRRYCWRRPKAGSGEFRLLPARLWRGGSRLRAMPRDPSRQRQTRRRRQPQRTQSVRPPVGL